MRMRKANDLTKEELVALAEGVQKTLYPGGDANANWDADTVAEIDLLLRDRGLHPGVGVDPDSLAFLQVPVRLLPFVINSLREGGHSSEAEMVASWTSQYTDPQKDAYRREIISLAESKCGEIEVDENAAISESGDGGEYLLAWLWVPYEEDEKEDEDED